jgi:hypothetical protein
MAEREALQAKREVEEGEEEIAKTAAEVQTDPLEKMMQLLDRIHRRVA